MVSAKVSPIFFFNGPATSEIYTLSLHDALPIWLLRYLHSTGASAFFVVVYLHMFRGLMYGSYKKPRELVWIFGMTIYLCLMAEAFLGYLLPRSEEHTSELQSRPQLVCRLLLEKK